MSRKNDPVVRTTLLIGAGSLALSLVMQAIFAALSRYNLEVFLGSVIPLVLVVGNFFLMGVTVRRATAQGDPEHAKRMVQASQAVRTVVLCALVGAGIALGWFQWIAAVVTLLFPRIIILGYQIHTIYKGRRMTAPAESEVQTDDDNRQ